MESIKFINDDNILLKQLLLNINVFCWRQILDADRRETFSYINAGAVIFLYFFSFTLLINIGL